MHRRSLRLSLAQQSKKQLPDDPGSFAKLTLQQNSSVHTQKVRGNDKLHIKKTVGVNEKTAEYIDNSLPSMKLEEITLSKPTEFPTPLAIRRTRQSFSEVTQLRRETINSKRHSSVNVRFQVDNSASTKLSSPSIGGKEIDCTVNGQELKLQEQTSASAEDSSDLNSNSKPEVGQKLSELSNSSDEEEQVAPTQKIDDRPLSGLMVMVDVRANNENRSIGVSNELRTLGAQVVPKYCKGVTHVVFKDGRRSTLNIAEKYSLFLVSVLWVDSCKTTWTHVSEALFPAQKPGSLDSPLIVGKLKRVKSLQPKAFVDDVDDSGKREARKRKRAKEEAETCKYQLDDIFKSYLDDSLNSPEEPSPKKTVNTCVTENVFADNAVSDSVDGITDHMKENENTENVSKERSKVGKKRKKVPLLSTYNVLENPINATGTCADASECEKSWRSGKMPLNAVTKTKNTRSERRRNTQQLKERDAAVTTKRERNETDSSGISKSIGPNIEQSSSDTDACPCESPSNSYLEKQTIALAKSKRDSSSASNEAESGKDSCSDSDIKRRHGRPKHTKRSRKIVETIVCTSMHVSEQQFIKSVVKELGRFSIRDQVTSTTTHILCGNNRRTLNILLGTVQGCWILSPSWAAKSYELGRWLDEAEYELTNWFPAAKESRVFRLKGVLSTQNSLFANCGWMYIADRTTPPFEDLVKLITKCGGQVTNSVRRACHCIGAMAEYREPVVMIKEKWILDSISTGELLPVKDYVIDTSSSKGRSPSPEF